MKHLAVLTAVLALAVGHVSADVGLRPESGDNIQKLTATSPSGRTGTGVGLDAPRFAGLLDSDRFSIQHSVGMNYTSGRFGGMNQYYLGTITYKAAEPLTIRAEVGVANTLFGTPIKGPGTAATQVIVPDVSVLYQPKDNLMIEFRFSQGGYGMPGQRWGDLWY